MDQKTLTELKDLAQALDSASTKIWQTIELQTPKANSEASELELCFTALKFELQTGAKLGEFEVAFRTNNLADKWNEAYNVLQNSNASIKDRYHGDGYQFSYWIFGEDRIYRQKLKLKPKK